MMGNYLTYPIGTCPRCFVIPLDVRVLPSANERITFDVAPVNRANDRSA